ncbi:MAG: hypothetical protein Q8M07_14665, partial [Prosthecobacter sp.]|nr:hypothetical protein [Prosthecobacter sp.]
MKMPSCFLRLSLFLSALALNPVLWAGSPDYQPELFKSTQLVYADSFDGELNSDFWEVRQNTTWVIKDG